MKPINRRRLYWICSLRRAEQPERKGLSFEDALATVKRQQETASDRFDEAFEKEKGRKDLIDAKFQEAMDRADELEMPIRDIDLD